MPERDNAYFKTFFGLIVLCRDHMTQAKISDIARYCADLTPQMSLSYIRSFVNGERI